MPFTFIPNPAANEVAKDIAKPHMEPVAEAGAEVARSHAAVDKGEMRDSIQVEMTPDGARVTVGSDHWMFVEFGTSRMAAQPFMRLIIDELGLNR